MIGTEIDRPHNSAQNEAVESLIRRYIREGRFVSGQRLIEADLAKHFGVMRSRVRDALRRLEAEGLVLVEKHRGASVRRISGKAIICMLDVLDSLSLLAVRKAIVSMEDKDFRKVIKSSLEELKGFSKLSGTEEKVEKCLDENVRFWDSIASVVDNTVLWQIRERLETLLFPLWTQGLMLNPDPSKGIMPHKEILSAILERDVRRAEKLILKASADLREVIAVVLSPAAPESVKTLKAGHS